MRLFFKLTLLCFCMLALSTQTANAGSGKGVGKTSTSVDVTNENSFMDEDGDIRVWLLSEDDTPPATKADALALESVSVPGSATAIFDNLDAGDYILAAAKESSFQALADDDAFTAGTDFAAVAFTLEDGDMAQYCTSSTADENVPALGECGPSDDGDDGDDGGDDGGGDDGGGDEGGGDEGGDES